jgi:hypothetical protein
LTTAVFNHTDLQKISDIALITCSDPVIRVSALRQLREMLLPDASSNVYTYAPNGGHLLESASPSWRLTLVSNLVNQISTLSDNTENKKVSKGFSTDVYGEMSELLLLLVKNSKTIRSCLSFLDHSTANSQNLVSIWGLVDSVMVLLGTSSIGTMKTFFLFYVINMHFFKY